MLKRKDISCFKSFMAPGSICIDDFEYYGCVVLNKDKDGLKLGLGNWRGNKVKEYDVLRVRRISQ